MSVLASFKRLTPGTQATILVGGGLALLVGGIAFASSGSAAKAGGAPQPLPGPGPTPLPIPEKAPYHLTYRGVTATIGQDPNDASRWIAVYEINGQKTGITAITNESGIIARFNASVDAYYSNAKWYAVNVTNGATVKADGVVRLSLPADTRVALPFITSAKAIDFTHLPVDWPAEDRVDATRLRYELHPSTDFVLPPLPGAFAWALSVSSPSA